jgi:dethiobiotin synthase
VTGTDTGVGKTVVSAILCARLGAGYWKPIQTGMETDSATIRKWMPSTEVFREAYSLAEPLSPHAAAKMEGIEISLAKIVASKPNCLRPMVIEGAGGVLVPINDRDFIIDLLAALKFPAVVVSRSGLGTINHTLLTLSALRAKQIPIAGVVMVGESNAKNRETIESFGNVQVIGEVPICSEISRRWIESMADVIHFSKEDHRAT